jgi:SAM-dependent methyltransferase
MIDDKTFNTKFYTVIDIFKDWIPEEFDFSKSNILDFGCEFGIMTLAIALRLKPKKVVGVDINSYHKQLTDVIKDKIVLKNFPENLEFYQVNPVEKFSRRFQFDVVFTWSTFEHVNQPNLGEVVSELYNCLSPNGFVFFQIAPLYYSAFGSHLETLIDKPWAHLLMQNNLLKHAVMTTPKNNIYKNEDDENYEAIKASIWSCYETLNKITADEVIELFETNGFKTIKQKRIDCFSEPPESLTRLFLREVLKTEQIVALFQKKKLNPSRRAKLPSFKK